MLRPCDVVACAITWKMAERALQNQKIGKRNPLGIGFSKEHTLDSSLDSSRVAERWRIFCIESTHDKTLRFSFNTTSAGPRRSCFWLGGGRIRVRKERVLKLRSTMDFLTKGKELFCLMIYIGAWVNHCGVQTRAARNLNIHTAKMQRLCWLDMMEFLEKVESPKKAKRLGIRNAKEVSELYETVIAEMNEVFRDIAAHKNEGRIDDAKVRQEARAFLAEANAYAKKHSAT